MEVSVGWLWLARRGLACVVALSSALAVTVGVANSTAGDASAASGQVAFREVAEGSRASNLRGEHMHVGGRVLRNASQAAGVLRAWGLDRAATASVDFDRESAIVVLAQYQPTGGYRARVSRVVVRDGEAVVTASVRYGGGELATQSIERPWVVIALKRTALAGISRAVRIRLR